MAATRACMIALVTFLVLEGVAAAAVGTAGTSELRRRQVRSLLKKLNKAPLASIESPDGDIIDCVHISKQPAFDHPLLKNHTIQMRPSCHPEGLYDDSNVSTYSMTQTWHQNGKCPANTIPIRRTKEEDILRASSVTRFGKKSPMSVPKFLSVDEHNPLDVTIGHQHAVTYTRKGFVQTNNKVGIGASFSPVSSYGGLQYEITILIWKDPKGGNWWLQVGSNILGYWPSSIFSNLQNGASNIMWGGEVYSPYAGQTSTNMGSGHFPREGFGKASYIKNIQVVDSFNKLKPPGPLGLGNKQPNCYSVQSGSTSKNWGTYMFYGGPGKNPSCP
ncbi:unnamed protein product [Urochloa decumbens]|uniref:Neprosin PEP catalytic domain-containing protein n=1 Tax=Urochloa decumbens TaxID=240449 RepID=A0ABC9B1N9_9POAL